MDDENDRDEQDLEDGLVAMRAAIDQLIATSTETARAAFGMFEAFTAEGFSESQALYLTAVQLTSQPGSAP